MNVPQLVRRSGSAVVRRIPLGVTRGPLRGAVLNERAWAARSMPLEDLSSVPTATLVSLLSVVPNQRVRARVDAIADEVVRRRPEGVEQEVAIEALVRAGRLDLLRQVRAEEDAALLGASLDAIFAVEAELETGDYRPIRELKAALGGGRRGARLLADVAVAARAWDVVAEVAPAVATGPTLQTWARTALRDGDYSAAVALDEASAEHSGVRRSPERFARVADRVSFLNSDVSALSIPADTEGYEKRDNAILYVASQSLPHRTGGYATRTHGIVTALGKSGWDVRVLTRLGFPVDRADTAPGLELNDHDVVDGIEYWYSLREDPALHSQTPMASYVVEGAKDVIAHAKAHGASVIHAASFFQTGLAAALAAEALGVPFVYEIRGLQELFLESRDPRFKRTEEYAFWRASETEVMRRADVVLCITEAIARDVESRGIPREKLKVLANGVWPDDFSPSAPDTELIHELGIEGKAVIGYAGSIVDYEGLELLCDAVEILAQERDDLAVVIVGDGPAMRNVRARVEGSASEPLVTFVGRVPHSQVARYLSVFDVMPFPRLPLIVCEEVSPMKPFEAMAMGKAVVVSSVAALTEIVTDGVDGLAFTKGDAESLAAVLGRLIDDPALRARLGAEARTTIETKAAWSARVTSAAAAYRELTAR